MNSWIYIIVTKVFPTIDIFKKPNGYKFLLSERRRGKEEAWVFITLKLVRNIKSGVQVANPQKDKYGGGFIRLSFPVSQL